MRRFSYNDLLNSERETREFSNSYLKGFYDNFPFIVDTLIQLGYFATYKESVYTLDGQFLSYCAYQYYQVPYSFRACYVLYENGYYLESSYILRSLIEILVKIKYLNIHRDHVQNIWTGKKIMITTAKGKERKLTLKDIFEEICPGFYEINYGKLLSGFHHGSVGSLIFRVNGRADATKEYIMGSKWHEKNAPLIVNYLTALGYGYLNNFPIFFSSNFKEIDPVLLIQYTKTIMWLKEAIEAHKRAYPKSISWYSEMEGFLY